MTRLSDADRAILQRARDLADAATADDLRAFLAAEPLGMTNPLAHHVGNGDSVKAGTLAIAQSLLAGLVSILDRLDGAHRYVRPGQVAPDRPAPDACMACGQPEATHDAAAGPFETEQEVRLLPAVRAVYAAFDADPGMGKMAPHNHRMLCEALSAAGVELGAYDHRIVMWLANWEPQTVAVVAGWVQRARLFGGQP